MQLDAPEDRVVLLKDLQSGKPEIMLGVRKGPAPRSAEVLHVFLQTAFFKGFFTNWIQTT